MLQVKLSPKNCNEPNLKIKCNLTSEEPPKYRLYSIQETDQFDGTIFMDDSLEVDEQDRITLRIQYTPECDGSGFKKEELEELKKIIGKSLFKDNQHF